MDLSITKQNTRNAVTSLKFHHLPYPPVIPPSDQIVLLDSLAIKPGFQRLLPAGPV